MLTETTFFTYSIEVQSKAMVPFDVKHMGACAVGTAVEHFEVERLSSYTGSLACTGN